MSTDSEDFFIDSDGEWHDVDRSNDHAHYWREQAHKEWLRCENINEYAPAPDPQDGQRARSYS